MEAGGEAVFILNCPDGPLSLRESHSFNRQTVSRIQNDLATHLTNLCQKWSEIHGCY